ncbi:MAG: glycosyltransferase family 2 protein [Alphaproteobacteria bacterium]
MFKKNEAEIMKNWNSKIPLLTIAAIAYNHERFIAAALDSFLMQKTNFPFIIIIHDDASTDDTTKIVKEYAEKFPNIIKTIIRKENQFTKEPRNAGFKNFFDDIKTKYMAICECDDYWTDENKLQIQFDFLESNPDYSVCYHDIIWKDEVYNTTTLQKSSDASCEDLIKRKVFFHTSSSFFRNVIMPLPYEYNLLKGGDFFLNSLLGNHGKGKYLPDIKPSVYNRLTTGITNTDRQTGYVDNFMDKILTHKYYAKIGKKEYADYYLDLATNVILTETSFFKLLKYVALRLPQIIKRFLIINLPKFLKCFCKKS